MKHDLTDKRNAAVEVHSLDDNAFATSHSLSQATNVKVKAPAPAPAVAVPIKRTKATKPATRPARRSKGSK